LIVCVPQKVIIGATPLSGLHESLKFSHRQHRVGFDPFQKAAMTQRDVVFPPGRQALYERNRYSPAIRSNGLLFVSGQVGSREDGSPEPDLEAQVRLAFDNLNAILKAAGCTFDDVIDVTVFIVDPGVLGQRAAPDADGRRRDVALWLRLRDQGGGEASGDQRRLMEGRSPHPPTEPRPRRTSASRSQRTASSAFERVSQHTYSR
jgi:enamine deaminase RidA (YjgF/YER057c/UK114 family)